ncbi:hypothetical protein HDU76_000854, partial [Blyttiomyces sp. JEL0837]
MSNHGLNSSQMDPTYRERVINVGNRSQKMMASSEGTSTSLFARDVTRTPESKRRIELADRYIPIRSSDDAVRFHLLQDNMTAGVKRKNPPDADLQQEFATEMYHTILKVELTGIPPAPHEIPRVDYIPSDSPLRKSNVPTDAFLRFTPNRKRTLEAVAAADLFSPTPLSRESRVVLATPRKVPRNIARSPYKVLDAPELQDDFYLNLVDWSSSNILGVGLGTCVYLWSAITTQWNPKGNCIAIGTNRGVVELWDPVRSKKIRELGGHDSRVGTLAWSPDLLTSGS